MAASTNTRNSLLERARSRDPSAWRELVDLYGPLVASWCRRSLRDPHAVADCVQDVFAAVSGSLDSFEPRQEQGSFRAWLWTVTRNKIRDHFRRAGRQTPAVGGSTMMGVIQQVADDQIPLEEPTSSMELNQLVRQALQQVQAEFEPKTWTAFWRTVVDGVATSVVAQEIGVTEATIRQYRSRVLRRLRQQLGDVR